jgi:hypothetical protein
MSDKQDKFLAVLSSRAFDYAALVLFGKVRRHALEALVFALSKTHPKTKRNSLLNDIEKKVNNTKIYNFNAKKYLIAFLAKQDLKHIFGVISAEKIFKSKMAEGSLGGLVKVLLIHLLSLNEWTDDEAKNHDNYFDDELLFDDCNDLFDWLDIIIQNEELKANENDYDLADTEDLEDLEEFKDPFAAEQLEDDMYKYNLDGEDFDLDDFYEFAFDEVSMHEAGSFEFDEDEIETESDSELGDIKDSQDLSESNEGEITYQIPEEEDVRAKEAANEELELDDAFGENEESMAQEISQEELGESVFEEMLRQLFEGSEESSKISTAEQESAVSRSNNVEKFTRQKESLNGRGI